MLKYFLAVSALFVFVSFQYITASAAGLCEGQARNIHDKGGYKFVTSSKVYKAQGVHIYETCVGNLSQRDVEFDWFVPGPNTWLPPNEQVPAPRPFNSRNTLDSAKSCMAYGNLSETNRFYFLGHASDKEALNREISEPCSFWVSQDSTVSDGEELSSYQITIDLAAFFPTDKSNPGETMMKFVGVADLFHSGEELVTSIISYQFAPYPGRKGGDPAEVTMRPVDVGTAGELLRLVFNASLRNSDGRIEKGRPMASSDKFQLRYQIEPGINYELTSTRYGFYDRDDQFVGAVFVPILAPRNSE